jgi:hypothetical protein
MVCWLGEADDAEPELGDEIASNSGYGAFIEWAAELGDDYAELAALAENGVIDNPESLGAVEAQLARALRQRPDRPTPDVLGVAKRLLAALQQRPKGTAAMSITDGTAGEGDEDE